MFKDLFDEFTGLKYQITTKVLLRKHKENGTIEFAPVYFSSTYKTTISFDKYMLDNLFKKLIIGLLKSLVG